MAFFFRDQDIDPQLAQELAEVRRILRLAADGSEFRVVFGATSTNPNEIAILSRSVIRILSELAASVEVPIAHLASGTAPFLGDEPSDATPLLRILSCAQKPPSPFVAVCYEGHWFWIEKSDFYSKRTLGYVLLLLALADTAKREDLPMITIQAN